MSGAYTEGDGWLCAREALEESLLITPEELSEDVLAWGETVSLAAQSADPADVYLMHGMINSQLPIEGNDWTTWGTWAERRLREALERPETLHPELEGAYALPLRLGDKALPPLTGTPEPDAVRRWPTASDGFSEFFGPSRANSLDVGWDQACMLRARSESWRTALAGECDGLLLLDDEDLRATVVALGSIVAPAAFRVRHWITWMAWRIREFDWS